MNGTVKFFDVKKGYGFITDENGEDHFVHYGSIQMDGFKKLKKGQPVTFEIGQQPSGRMAAVQVTPMEAASQA